MKTLSSKFSIALALVGFSTSCVSVKKHELIREQLRIEQTSALRYRAELTKLTALVANLNTQIDTLKTQADHARVMGRANNAKASSRRDVLVGSILFASGQESLSDKDRANLASIAKNLTEFKDVTIVVQGHSDPTPLTKGKYRSNMHLSTMRALVVYHEIIGIEGIEPANCVVEGRGEFLPGTRPEKELRRVDIIARSTELND